MKTCVLRIPDSISGDTVPDKLSTWLQLKFPHSGYGRWLAERCTPIWAFRGLSWGPSVGNQQTDWHVTVQGEDSDIDEIVVCAAR